MLPNLILFLKCNMTKHERNTFTFFIKIRFIRNIADCVCYKLTNNLRIIPNLNFFLLITWLLKLFQLFTCFFKFSNSEKFNKKPKQNKKLFITLLNKHRVGKSFHSLEKLMKLIVIHTFHSNYPTGMKLFKMIYLPGELYTVQARDKVSGACIYPLALFSISQRKKNRNLRNNG